MVTKDLQKKMTKDLTELRKKWEDSWDVFAMSDTVEDGVEKGEITILLGDGDLRKSLRYFTVDVKWHVSVDFQMTADEALIQALNLKVDYES